MQANQQPKVWKALTLIGIVCDEEVKDDLSVIRSGGKGEMVQINFIYSYKYTTMILGCHNFHS
jgi:hypothetical protein